MDKVSRLPEMAKTQTTSPTLAIEVKERLSSLEKKIRFTPKTDRSFLLQTFGHQVSGRATMLCFDSNTICKSYVSREIFFYHCLPSILMEFTPQFRGVINVTFVENTQTGAVLPYAQPLTRLQPLSRDIFHIVEEPKPHSKRCVRDFGKTHVIFPTDPSLVMLRENPTFFADEVESLTHGFDANVTLRSENVPTSDVDDRSGESSGLCNPWSSKVIDHTWAKLKSNYIELGSDTRKVTIAKTKRFMLLENVTAPYRRPCVLDLKIGTRVRQNASAAKLARHVTAIDLGARLSGMQIFHPKRREFDYINKYCGYSLSVDGFKAKIIQFFSRGHTTTKRPHHKENSDLYYVTKSAGEESNTVYWKTDVDLVKCIVTKLTRLRNSVASLEAHRFYSCSVLLIYEGDVVPDLSQPVQTGRNRSLVIGSSGDHDKPVSRLHSPAVPEHKQRQRRPRSLPMQRSGYTSKSDDSSPDIHQRTCETQGRGDGTHIQNAFQTTPKHKSKKMESKGVTSRTDPVKSDGAQSRSSPKRSTKSRRRTKSCSAFRKHEPGKICHTTPGFSRQSPADELNVVDVRLIDFAHFCFRDSTVHPGPDGGFLFGLDNVISLLKGMLCE